MNVENHGPYYNLFNLGGAHGHYEPPNLAAFKEQLVKLVLANTANNNFIAVTNNGQSIVRGYMEETGFISVRVSRSLIVHTITRDQLLSPKLKKEVEEVVKKRDERLAARPRDKEGRLLRKDGKLVRRPNEFFVGDRIKWYDSHTRKDKVGSIRSVDGDVISTFRNKINRDLPSIEIVERVR